MLSVSSDSHLSLKTLNMPDLQLLTRARVGSAFQTIECGTRYKIDLQEAFLES